jgi:hypothetical protein
MRPSELAYLLNKRSDNELYEAGLIIEQTMPNLAVRGGPEVFHRTPLNQTAEAETRHMLAVTYSLR